MTAPARGALPSRHPLSRAVAIFFAVVIVVTPILMASWFALCPQYGDPACPGTANPVAYFPAARAAPPALLQLFLIINLVVPYVFPLSYIGMGMASWRNAPYFTACGVVLGWLASIAWGFIADELFIWTHMAGADKDALLGAAAQSQRRKLGPYGRRRGMGDRSSLCLRAVGHCVSPYSVNAPLVGDCDHCRGAIDGSAGLRL